MKYKNLLFLLINIIFFSSTTYAQPVTSIIEDNLTIQELKDVGIGDNLITSANLQMEKLKEKHRKIKYFERQSQNANSARDRRNFAKEAERRMLKLYEEMAEVVKNYRDGYDYIYFVYKNKLQNDCQLDDQEKMETINAYIAESKDLFTQAAKMEKTLYEVESPVHVLAEIQELRELGIEKQKEALYICFGHYGEPIEEEDYTSSDSTYVLEEELTESASNDASITFRVQIIAVTKKLSDATLSKIYHGSSEIHEKLDFDGLYKYMVGNFKSYQPAKELRDKLGGDTFVVATKNGKRIDIDTAINLSKSSKEIVD